LYLNPVSSIAVESILGWLPFVPVGNTGTILYEMQRESGDFPGASCDKTKDGKDGCRQWFEKAGPWDDEPSDDGNKGKNQGLIDDAKEAFRRGRSTKRQQ
jgi:hypothetical protein